MTRWTMLLCLGACATAIDATPRTPDFALPEQFAARPANDAGTPPAPDWWRSFADARLDAVVREALEHNRDLAAAAARLDAAVAVAEIRGADFSPQLAARLDSARRRQNFIGLPLPGRSGVLSSTSTTRGLGLDLSWELDLWGRIRAGALAAHHDVEASVADLLGARLSIAARTARTWFALVEARGQLAIAESTARNHAASSERVLRRFESGTRPPLDVRLARAEAESAQADVARRRRIADEFARELAVLLGRYPDASLTDTGELPAPIGEVPAGLPSELLRRRPDLVAAERRLVAADARLAEARRALLPRISLTASGGTSSDRLEDLADWDFRVWSIAANLIAPLFEGGRLRAGVRARDAERDNALADYGAAMLVAFREVEGALAAERWLALEHAHVAAAAESAAAASRLSEERYDLGLADVITMLESQRRALTTRSALLALRRARLDTRVDLIVALGGGFTPADAEPPPTGTLP